MDDLLSVKQAAVELGGSPSSVYAAIAEGRLPTVTFIGKKAIRRVDLEEYRARTRPTGEKPKGRPKKANST